MKKWVLTIMALTFVVNSAFADGGYNNGGGHHGGATRPPSKIHDDNDEPFKVSEFFCGIIGGGVGGFVLNKAGANTPFTFLGAILGGVLGVKFCRWLHDPERLGKQAAVFAANLDAPICSERVWRSDDYHGTLKILAQSVHKNNGRTCKLFETTIVDNKTHDLIKAKTKAWACRDRDGEWHMSKERWMSRDREDYRVCGNYPWPPRGDEEDENCGGSVSVGRVEPPRDLPIGPVTVQWDLGAFRRRINDYDNYRSLKLARRVREFPGEIEEGLMKAVSDDGRAAVIYFSNERQVIVPMDDVGIECRGSRLCYEMDVTSRDGLHGRMQYVFNNGDVVVNDLMNGKQIRPASWINVLDRAGDVSRASPLR